MDQAEDEVIGRRVREARGSMSQQEVASLIPGWTQNTVTNVETGKRPLRFTEAIALADELAISLDSLAGRPSVNEDALRRWAREADDRLRRALFTLQEIYREQDPLTKPWEG